MPPAAPACGLAARKFRNSRRATDDDSSQWTQHSTSGHGLCHLHMSRVHMSRALANPFDERDSYDSSKLPLHRAAIGRTHELKTSAAHCGSIVVGQFTTVRLVTP